MAGTQHEGGDISRPSELGCIYRSETMGYVLEQETRRRRRSEGTIVFDGARVPPSEGVDVLFWTEAEIGMPQLFGISALTDYDNISIIIDMTYAIIDEVIEPDGDSRPETVKSRCSGRMGLQCKAAYVRRRDVRARFNDCF